MNKEEQIAGLIVGSYLREHGITDPSEILDMYNKKGIKDDETIMLIMVSALYYKSPLRKRLR